MDMFFWVFKHAPGHYYCFYFFVVVDFLNGVFMTLAFFFEDVFFPRKT